MARKKIFGVATEKDGATAHLELLIGATVNCYRAGTALAINQYATEGAGSPSTILSDSQGNFEFWIDDDYVHARIKLEVIPVVGATQTEDDIQAFETAEIVVADTTNFDGILTAADVDVQKALETLDDGSVSYVNAGEVYYEDSSRGDKKLSVSVIQVGAGRSNNNVTNSYLQSYGSVFMNLKGFTLPWDATLVGISMTGNDATDTWTAEVRKNDAVGVEDSLTITTALSNTDYTKNTDFNSGDRIQIYMNGTGVNNPYVVLFFRRRTA